MEKLQQGGVVLTADGADFAIWSRHAVLIELCLFDAAGAETRLPMLAGVDGDADVHRLSVAGIREGARYGYRAHGTYEPDNGLWFDPSKLLADPYAKIFDRPFVYDVRLGIFGEDTAALMPKAIVTADIATTVYTGASGDIAKREAPRFAPGGLIYEVAVRPFTILHPDIPKPIRGTVAALAHPAIIAHLKRIGVDAIELMPITAWIDERHLPPLGLSNGWGYNPVSFMALDPRLVPGGVKELRDTVAALHAEGIAVILDLVFNHTGESDRFGSTLSLRGLDNLSFYRHAENQPGQLINDTGTGNTVACDHPYIRQLIIDSLRHFVLQAGIDGFRFDLAPIIGRTATGFQAEGGTLSAMLADPVLADSIMIAEPWDIGPGGYQLGNFPAPFLEWNDKARDETRRYWRGDHGMTGDLATLLSGSAPLFERDGRGQTRSVNFLAAHDGFTLMDLVSNQTKHNEANGEDNRDGHGDNLSWNNGVEGQTEDATIVGRRRTDVMALLSTLFATRGTIMLTSGDEAGRSQRGNNNAYCQDNDITWVDWQNLDQQLIDHTAFVSRLRKRFAVFAETRLLTADDVAWLSPSGSPMTVEQWQAPDGATLAMLLNSIDRRSGRPAQLAVLINRGHQPQSFTLPQPPPASNPLDTASPAIAAAPGPWQRLSTDADSPVAEHITVPSRTVHFLTRSR